MKRREFIALIGSAAAWPCAVWGQQTGKMPSIGFLAPNASVCFWGNSGHSGGSAKCLLLTQSGHDGDNADVTDFRST
jgi:hypothetical protein